MNQPAPMTRREKTKVILSLFGVGVLTVAAYWAQSPTVEVSTEDFQTNLIAAETNTLSNSEEDTLSKKASETTPETTKATESQPTEESPTSKSPSTTSNSDLFDLLGVEKDKTPESNTPIINTTATNTGTTLTNTDSTETAAKSRFETEITVSPSNTTTANLAAETTTNTDKSAASSLDDEVKKEALPETGPPLAVLLLGSATVATFLKRKKQN